MPATEPTDQKGLVNRFFEFIMSGNVKDSLPFFSSDCKQHNPYVSGGMNELMDSMIAVQERGAEEFHAEADSFEPAFTIRHVIEEGDIVVVHTEMKTSKSDPSKGGLRQAHIFRFKDDKIVEYWDITQMLSEDLPNTANAFS
jgi:predicted SnoaL-like aldol condensation-catalyzing enzyme